MHIHPIDPGKSVVIDSCNDCNDCNDGCRNSCNDGISLKDAVADGFAREAVATAKLNDTVKDARYDLNSSIGDVKGTAQALAAQTNQYIDCKIDAVNAKLCCVSEKLCGVELSASQAESRMLLESSKNASAMQIQAERIASESRLAAQVASSAAQILAMQNQAIINDKFAIQAAASASCCCELKEKIAEDGQKTRDLICHNYLQEQLSKTAEATARAVAAESKLFMLEQIKCHHRS